MLQQAQVKSIELKNYENQVWSAWEENKLSAFHTVETVSSEIKQNYASIDVIKICFDLRLNW